MTIATFSAAKTVCVLKDWSVSHLALQKILYLANMKHLGDEGNPLVPELFHSCTMGVILPSLEKRARGFGRNPVKNVFHWENTAQRGSSEEQCLSAVVEATLDASGGRLVSLTHREGGAWAQCYTPGASVPIPLSLVMQDYVHYFGEPRSATSKAHRV